MILLLGASGYVGRAFASELHRRGYAFLPLTRKAIDYTNFDLLFTCVRQMRPEFLINAAGYTGRPDVDACEQARGETLMTNTLLPQTIARACLMTHTPWGHVSSGDIYSGAKIVDNGRMRIERNLNRPELRRLLAEKPETVFGFTEGDEPNSSFRRQPCNFYSGSKALAEEVICGMGECYVWRPGMPFNGREESRNFLWRIQRNVGVYDSVCSISHVGDFVRACLSLWERQAPFGTYNVTNPGPVTTHQIVGMIQRILKPNRRFEFWKDDAKAYGFGSRPLQFHGLLDVSKLLAAGVEMRPAGEALEDSLQNWRWDTRPFELLCHH